jgi:hydrogenase expression/formation protein HypD
LTIRQLEEHSIQVENQYTRSVRREGNTRAKELLTQVFETTDRKWRGIGEIPGSGYRLREDFAEFDAERVFDVGGIEAQESTLCIAGQVLQGLKKPHECDAFGKECTPEKPLGAPMVSSEGACAAYYHYGKAAS